MRLFTALDVPQEIAERLRAVIDPLRPTAKLTWSPLQNLHVTTKFIGEWSEHRVEEMKNTLATVPQIGAIEISVRGLGWFPNPRNPRVFWAGIEAGEELGILARETERTVAALGVPVEDREFRPHLTLARRRDAAPLEHLRQALSRLGTPDFGAFQAKSFFLYLSAGGKYTRLQEFPLMRI